MFTPGPHSVPASSGQVAAPPMESLSDVSGIGRVDSDAENSEVSLPPASHPTARSSEPALPPVEEAPPEAPAVAEANAGGFSIEQLPEKDQKVARFVLGKRASRDLDAEGDYLIHRGEKITLDTVKLAIEFDMLTLLFLAASDAG